MMRKKTLLCCLSAVLAGYASAASAQDVYVDLSVLDSLGVSTQNISAPEPLFPVLPPQPKHKPARKKAVKKAEKISAPKAEPQVKVEVKEKIEIPSPVNVAAPAVEQHQPIPYVESSERVVVVDVEPVAPQTAAQTSEPSVEKAPQASAPVSPAVETPAAAPAVPVAAVETPSVSPAAQELLLNEDDNADKPVLGSLVFSGEEVELNDEQKAKVDAAVSAFKDLAHNKIAIYSYNLDDGVDAFKKKRLSLNRALEVRSYLMQKGHKNFSIKVLNVDAASGKANTVEIEELQ